MINYSKQTVHCWESFYNFCYDAHTLYGADTKCYHSGVGGSMEQLWLAFVMQEKYEKRWTKNNKWGEI